jgi:putative transposase
MPLKIRLWECPMCGQTHDRDENAANNILAEGLSVLACGETIRPGQSTGTSQRNRKAIGVSL